MPGAALRYRRMAWFMVPAMLLGALVLRARSGSADRVKQCPRGLVGGTFVQPWNHHTQWQTVLSERRELGLEGVVVQFTDWIERGSDDRPVHTSTLPGLRKILNDPGRFDVWVGLVADEKYFYKVIKPNSTENLEAYLEWLRSETLRHRDRLWNELNASERAGVTGWYIHQELDNQNWSDRFGANDQRRQTFNEYLVALVADLKKGAAKRPVSISGFANDLPGRLDEESTAGDWSQLLKGTKIDRFFFQTGVGTFLGDESDRTKMPIARLPKYVRRLKPALAKAVGNRKFVFALHLELYEAVRGAPGGRAPARSLEFIQVQRRAFRGPRRHVYSFSAPHYMSKSDFPHPRNCRAAAALLDKYLGRWCRSTGTGAAPPEAAAPGSGR